MGVLNGWIAQKGLDLLYKPGRRSDLKRGWETYGHFALAGEIKMEKQRAMALMPLDYIL
jgi:hypothetical protein